MSREIETEPLFSDQRHSFLGDETREVDGLNFNRRLNLVARLL